MAVAVEAADEAVVEDDEAAGAPALAASLEGPDVWDWSLVVSPSTGLLSSVDMQTPVELLLEFRRVAELFAPHLFKFFPLRHGASGGTRGLETFQAMMFEYNAAAGDCADRERFKAGMRAV
ncbi:MAG TPA: hypothetical protein VNA19_13105 [Pyrinomonadaceae bacterium]|nr:hypothetical protein [Pyrinomonadaceae bacterium]